MECKDDQVCIKFKDFNSTNFQARLDSVVRVCDEALISRDGYRQLAAVIPVLFREYLVADRRNKINELIGIQIPIKIFKLDYNTNQSNSNNNVNENFDGISIDNNEVENGAFRSISDLLKILISVWKSDENSIIIPGDTLYIKLGGDGRNVGRKQNHVMITFCLLNEGDEVLKPNHQFRYVK